ncbi:glycosyltransferase family 4 protein [Pedobacter aquae]|uniref:Glycosyltransferase family 4 protein n=1 Tax=Pedobacter aquae TaxID=2605747 RepID=A0A5C0VH59_9SPHI|nr:glycosyltransferase family 4 protein [Pedobacter aquae]QEK50324.1 glycosyltransferase family 4 protein [Pedobacter aquae]
MHQNIKRICLITPGHIASNPRLVKEATALDKAGYKVHIIFTQYMNYLINDDFDILKSNPNISFDYLDWTGSCIKSKVIKLLFGLIHKASLILNLNWLSNLILNRNYFWQLKSAKAYKADLYIAHNVGALSVAANAAEKTLSKYAFDAEDFHREENLSSKVLKSLIHVEDLYLPKAIYITASSPLIAQEYQRIYLRQVIPIMNVFPKIEHVVKKRIENQDKSIKLFWFSQKIGVDRGLIEVIEALGIIKNDLFELHLLGLYNKFTKETILSHVTKASLNHNKIYFYKPIPPDLIFDFAQQFDIGMATEIADVYNREICLTNKIFTYIQSGLAVIASNTVAQLNLFNDYPIDGILYQKRNSNSIAIALSTFLDENKLENSKQNNYILGQTTLNWDIEKQKFLFIINNL